MSIADIVSTLVEEYTDDGIVIVPRSAVVKELKERRDDESVAQDTVRPAFEDEGWAYSRHLYYDPDRLAERAETIATGLRNAGRLVVAETDFVERVADPTPPRVEEGWKKSDAIDLLRETVTETGWTVERATKPASNTTRSKVFYIRPLRDALAAEHPNGCGGFTSEDLFAWYLSQSVRQHPGEE